MFLLTLLAGVTTTRRRCRMCGGGTESRQRFCGAHCRTEWLDFYHPGA